MSGEIHADLHIHTTNSDGQFELAEIPGAAKEAGVAAVAITDHDSIHPELNAPFERREGIGIIRGIELRVQPAMMDERIDLLGYGVTETQALCAELDRLQTNRKQRAARIIEMVEDEIDSTLDLEVHEGIGRPHIARAIDANPDTDIDYGGAFETLIGNDGPCYVSRDVTSFEQGVELLSEACEVVSLAHPYRYDDPETALELATQLDAVECIYAYSNPNVPANPHLDEDTAVQHDLLITGGSDAHTKELGYAGLLESHYEQFRAAAGFDA